MQWVIAINNLKSRTSEFEMIKTESEEDLQEAMLRQKNDNFDNELNDNIKNICSRAPMLPPNHPKNKEKGKPGKRYIFNVQQQFFLMENCCIFQM